MTTISTATTQKKIHSSEQIDEMTESEREAFAKSRLKRRGDDSFLFHSFVGLEDWCSRCWEKRGILSRMFIDDGYPIAEMECGKCKHSYTFNVIDL